jgi:hypothetical protein
MIYLLTIDLNILFGSTIKYNKRVKISQSGHPIKKQDRQHIVLLKNSYFLQENHKLIYIQLTATSVDHAGNLKTVP